MKQNTPKLGNRGLVLIVGALIIAPIIFVKGEFSGADGEAQDAITEINPQYQPWFKPVFEPPSGEIENLLFVSQAALGAGLIGYVIGLYKGRAQKSSESDKP
ncbi:MAG: energy-coupling factor ABC transporter substrate-binding protein [Spirulinaceae cyanobacterium]